MELKIGIFQVNTSDSELPKIRIDRVLEKIFNAGSLDLVILPEHWISGAFSANHDPQEMCFLYKKFLQDVGKLAKKSKLVVHSGSGLVSANNKKFYNASYIIDPKISTEIMYSKIHPFFNEYSQTTAGNQIVKFYLNGVTISLAICYDLRFPELFRQTENFGSHLFIVSAAWPLERVKIWKHLLVSRAIENQAYVIGVNGVGVQNDYVLGGNSMLVNPHGDVDTALDTLEDLKIVTVNSMEVESHRQKYQYINDVKLINRS
jgi:predicted amidohydrolase